MPDRLFADRAALGALCRQRHIRRLSLFGSVLKGGARPDSDVDLLVEFSREARPSFLDLAEIEQELSTLLAGRRVDLRTAEDLSRYFRDEVLREAQVQYESRDRVRLQHLANALNSAIRFARGRERDDLDTDEMLLFALVRAIEIAGEAASQVTAKTRTQLPDLPWASIIGMRNRLVHAYFDINRDILWTTVAEAAPPLAERSKNVLVGDEER